MDKIKLLLNTHNQVRAYLLKKDILQLLILGSLQKQLLDDFTIKTSLELDHLHIKK